MNTAATPYEVARKAREVFDQNLDTLIAGFLIRHPDIDPSTVCINWMPAGPNGDGMKIFITPIQIPIPEAKARTEGDGSGDHCFKDGWNACREELINSLAAKKQPSIGEDPDAS